MAEGGLERGCTRVWVKRDLQVRDSIARAPLSSCHFFVVSYIYHGRLRLDPPRTIYFLFLLFISRGPNTFALFFVVLRSLSFQSSILCKLRHTQLHKYGKEIEDERSADNNSDIIAIYSFL
jgi:hypothetical protein